MISRREIVGSKTGSAAIMVAFVTSVALFAGTFGFLSLQKTMLKVQQQANVTHAIRIVSQGLLSNLQHPMAWANTINSSLNNPNSGNSLSACLRNMANCPATGSIPLVLYDGSNAVMFDGTVASNGFTSGGQPCNSFNAVAGSGTDACPFGLSLTWTPTAISNPNQCVSLVEVTATYTYNPGSTQRTIAFNSANYGLTATMALGGYSRLLGSSCIATAGYTSSQVVPPVTDLFPTLAAGASLTPPLGPPDATTFTLSRSEYDGPRFVSAQSEAQGVNATNCGEEIMLSTVNYPTGASNSIFPTNSPTAAGTSYLGPLPSGTQTVGIPHGQNHASTTCGWTNRTLAVVKLN